MKNQDLLSILVTFFVGFVAGGYLYVVGFAPTVANIEVPTIETFDELTIESEVYGGCRGSCPSFQLLGDGSFRYLYSRSVGEDQVLKTGSIPFALRRDLQTSVTEAELERQSRRTTPALCESFADGIDVRYEVILDGDSFLLDTCGTAVDTDSALWLNINRVWDYLETSGS